MSFDKDDSPAQKKKCQHLLEYKFSFACTEN